MKKINREELNNYWWHRLYKVLLWFITIIIFVGVFYFYIFVEDGDLILVAVGSIMFSSFAFVSIFLIYRIILYIAINKVLFNKIDKEEIYTAVLIGVMSTIVLYLLNAYY